MTYKINPFFRISFFFFLVFRPIRKLSDRVYRDLSYEITKIQTSKVAPEDSRGPP